MVGKSYFVSLTSGIHNKVWKKRASGKNYCCITHLSMTENSSLFRVHVSPAWCRPHVFPRMPKVACFPRWRPSRSRRLHFLQFTVFQLRFLIGSMVTGTLVLISDWLVTSVAFLARWDCLVYAWLLRSNVMTMYVRFGFTVKKKKKPPFVFLPLLRLNKKLHMYLS